MEFILGCNYWASNAGTEMWVEWDETAVEADLKKLAENGLKYLRVFPNWRDFQPVCAYYGYANQKKEYRHRDGILFDNPYCIDGEMMKRFERFTQIAERHGFRLIVGILTGWMSGRLFVPPILDGKDLFSDETALWLEQRFIKGFVKHFADTKTIVAWDLGNECNCMSETQIRERAAAWTAMVSNAIRANDPLQRPVISGMHSLGIDNAWTVFDQGEDTDILTTHPYPQFVPHCFKDDMVSYRTLLHATCEGIYYSDLGGKPCMTEELGTLGPMTCDDDTAAAFLKTNLYSNWANGSLGVLWWCGCEQVRLKTAPYSWCMLERELGLLNINGEPKKTLLTYRKFSEWLAEFGRNLPKAQTDAVCILTEEQDQWGTAYMSYALAKQTHRNIKFTYGQVQELPVSDFYLLPSIKGNNVIKKESFDKLMERVANGAALYISNDCGYLAEFEKFTGVHIKNSMQIKESRTMKLNGAQIAFDRVRRYMIESNGAQVLAWDDLGIPAFTKHLYGKGTVYYLNFPLETMLLEKNGAFDGNSEQIYSLIFDEQKKAQPIFIENKYVGMTCHFEEDECYVVLINYSDREQELSLKVNESFYIAEVFGKDINILPPNEAVILRLAYAENKRR